VTESSDDPRPLRPSFALRWAVLPLAVAGLNAAVFVARDPGFLFRPSSYGEVHGGVEVGQAPADFGEASIEAGRALLPPEATSGGSTRARVEALGSFLLARLEDARGEPSQAMEALPPLEQYRAALAGRGEVHCTNVAAIYAFFATAAGLPTRVVVARGGPDGHLGAAGHTVAETWSAEAGRWGMVDLQTRRLWVVDSSGAPRSTADLLRATAAGAPPALTVHGWTVAGGVRALPYAEARAAELEYFGPGTTLVYPRLTEGRASLGSRARRYVVAPEPSYSVRDEGRLRHWLKLGAFWGGLVALAGWALAAGRAVCNRRLAR
jgi:hypothetical protein